jgi:hypothetical protein
MNCYVTHPRSGSVLPEELTKDNTLFYPESRMSTDDCFRSSVPSDFHIVTDNVFLVSLYSTKEVFIWRNNKWVHPEIQTYGASYTMIIDYVFDYGTTIPTAILNGKTTNCMGRNRK